MVALCQINQQQRGTAAPVPYVHLLIPQGEHLLHGRDPGASEALVVLAHFDGVQPLRHRSEHGAVTAAGAGQANGHTASNSIYLDYSWCLHKKEQVLLSVSRDVYQIPR